MLRPASRLGTLLAFAAAVAVAMSTTACGNSSSGGGSSTDASGKTTIRFAVQQENFATIPMFLSQDLGFMRDEGLSIETTVGQSTSTMTAGLLGGSFDMQVGGAELLVARQQGAPLLAFAGECNSPVWSVIAKPGITRLADLRGRTIATSGPDSVSTVALVATLKNIGLDPDSYSQITAGGTAERYAAVQNGRADATLVASPQEFQAGEVGLRNLGSLFDSLPTFVAGFLVTTKAYAAGHAAVLDRFARAWLRTLRWIHDPANAAELVRRVSASLRVPQPVVRQAYDYWLTGARATAMFPVDGKIDTVALAGSVRAFVASGSLPASATDLSGFVVDDFMNHAESTK